jgi:hypothetical protein
MDGIYGITLSSYLLKTYSELIFAEIFFHLTNISSVLYLKYNNLAYVFVHHSVHTAERHITLVSTKSLIVKADCSKITIVIFYTSILNKKCVLFPL